MAITTYTPAAANALYNSFAGVAFDDPKAYTSHDNKRIDGLYFLKPVQDEILNLIQRQSAGGGAILVRNATGGSLNAGPVNVSGHFGTDAQTGNPVFKIQAADAAGNSKPAHALLLASLANNTSGVAYLGGNFNSGIDTSGSTLGNAVYLAAGGGVTLTAPSGSDQIVQIVGRVQTLANAGAGFGVVDGLVQLPTKLGSSWLQSGSVGLSSLGGATAIGDMIYSPNGSIWQVVSGNATTTRKFLQTTGNGSVVTSLGWTALAVGDVPWTSVTGDVAITSGGAATVGSINGVALGSTTATAGRLLIASGTQWVSTAMSGDATITSGGVVTVARINGVTLGSTTATAGNLLIGSGSQWVSTAMSGDATVTSGGVVTVTKVNNQTVTAAAAVGDMLYSDTGSRWQKLTGNSTTSNQFLKCVGNGSAVTSFGWSAVSGADLTAGTVTTDKLDTTNNGGTVHQWENILDNAQGKIAQRPSGSINTAAYGQCDRWKGQLTNGTGGPTTTLSQDTSAPVGNSGYAIKLNWSGTSVKARIYQGIEQKNAAKLKSRTVVFSANVRHDTGSSINFIMNIYPMTAADNGTSGTALTGGNLGANQSVSTGTSTAITSGAISIGSNAANGLIIEIYADASALGAITGKNVWFTDIQLQLGSTVTPCEERSIDLELRRCQRYYCKTYDQGTAAGTVTGNGQLEFCATTASSASGFTTFNFPVTMRTSPTTLTVYSPATLNASGLIRDQTSALDRAAGTVGQGDARVNVFNNAAVGGAGTILYCHVVADADF